MQIIGQYAADSINPKILCGREATNTLKRYWVPLIVSHGTVGPLGSFRITVIHTPGHSAGGVCFHAPGVVFTGDTLFAGSVGRTDFPGGDHHLLVQGVIQKIFSLGDELRVYPGHGPQSTIGRERMTNPFFTP